MKKTRVINSDISRVLAQMGHTDTIAIGDMGLPIPNGVERIDLAVEKGLPTLKSVLEVILSEMQVETFTIAEEAPSTFQQLCEQCFQNENNNIERLVTVPSLVVMDLSGIVHKPLPTLIKVPHEEFKQQLRNCKAVIRTGEYSPYYNVILSSNVTF